MLCATASWAQLTTEQKVQDFQTLASLYAKEYAPFAWKVQFLNYNLYNITPWLAKVKASPDDLTFYEIMAEYVTSLDDVHSEYFNASDFEAYLGMTVDIYDGKVLIDTIDRSLLPARQYPFQIGDQVVSVDGTAVEDLITNFNQFSSFGNPRSTSRYNSALITDRFQAVVPRAGLLGANAIVVVLRQSGNMETYTIPWRKTGTAIIQEGPVPTPQARKARVGPLVSDDGAPVAQTSPAYLHPLRYKQYSPTPQRRFPRFVRNFDGLQPLYTLPTGFVARLGRRAGDFFFSGTYKSGGKTIGLIRIADFEPVTDFSLIDVPEAQFDTEIAYMEKNTDALVIDIMRNPGGYGCYAEDLMSRLATKPFWDLVAEFRPTIFDVQGFVDSTQAAIDAGADQWEIDLNLAYQKEVQTAFSQDGGMTGPLPVCGLSLFRDPNTGTTGKLAIYDKPVTLLTDEFTTSSGDIFAAMFQDAQRGQIFGYRTSGAGGAILEYPIVGFFSEGSATVTDLLIIRQNPISEPGYPTAPYIENIGVWPDITYDYMTLDNLLQSGRPYVSAFTTAVLNTVQ
jgi:C-terminal processing protease CtpA/Prc